MNTLGVTAAAYGIVGEPDKPDTLMSISFASFGQEKTSRHNEKDIMPFKKKTIHVDDAFENR